MRRAFNTGSLQQLTLFSAINADRRVDPINTLKGAQRHTTRFLSWPEPCMTACTSVLFLLSFTPQMAIQEYGHPHSAFMTCALEAIKQGLDRHNSSSLTVLDGQKP